MGEVSAIEWTDATFNPWWGCTKVSPACRNCYAETWAKRTGFSVWGDRAERRTFSPSHWAEPVRWNAKAEREGRRMRVFCASMADVFEDAPGLDEQRAKLWPLIEATTSLDWLLLTKRPENIRRMVPWGLRPPMNVWLGTTVENQEYADERVPHLVDAPANVRFLSCEPLLGLVTLRQWAIDLDWVIVGGETGAGARPMDPAWARSLRDQCQEIGLWFHFKQWGDHDETGARVGKKAAGRVLDGRTWDEIARQYP